ncbi:MAG: rlmB [Parachlamydiales bacterium]|nr:rlmB [Parachlamydiales bacterium]
MSQESTRWPSKDQLIMGLHAIREVLVHKPDRLLKVFTSVSGGAAARKHEIIDECDKNGVPVQTVSFDLLTKMAGSDSHQSFVAHVKGRKFFSVDEFISEKEDQESTFVLMLSEIFDPQNFGALLRSAECFGADAVAWSKNRGCDLTPIAAKSSCGASELISLIRISNLADSVERFKKAGFEIVAAVAQQDAEPLTDFCYSKKTVLIVGSEGEGIQPLLLKKADRCVFIPTKGKIESLNVAQATAVLLSRLNY